VKPQRSKVHRTPKQNRMREVNDGRA